MDITNTSKSSIEVALSTTSTVLNAIVLLQIGEFGVCDV